MKNTRQTILELGLWIFLYLFVLVVFSYRIELGIAVKITTIILGWFFLVATINKRFLLKRFNKKKWFPLYLFIIISILSTTFFAFRYLVLIPEFGYPFNVKNIVDNNNAVVSRVAVHLVFIVLMLLQTLFISSLSDITKAFQNEKKLAAQFELEKKSAELKLVKEKLSPHFLLNALNNLLSIVELRPEQTKSHLFKLISLMKYVTYDQSEDEVELEKEINFIKDYIYFQQAKNVDDYDVQIHIDEEVEQGSIVPRILVTIVENAFKHSYNPDKKSNIQISILRNQDDFIFEVKNDTSPFLRNHNEQGYFGVGIKNIIEMLTLKYGENHRFINEKVSETYLAQLTIIDLFNENN